MKTWLLSLGLLLCGGPAYAVNYCGQTLNGYVTLDSDQNCVSDGIKLNAGATLDGVGRWHVYGYQMSTDKACIRALNTTTSHVVITNVYIEGCGVGINFDNVFRPRINYATVSKTRGNAAVRCAGCIQGIFHHNYISFNSANGLLIQGGSQNQAYKNSISGNGTGVRMTANASNVARFVQLYDNWIVYNVGWSVVFDGSTRDSYANSAHPSMGWWIDRVIFTNGTTGNFARGYNSCRDDSGRGQCQ